MKNMFYIVVVSLSWLVNKITRKEISSFLCEAKYSKVPIVLRYDTSIPRFFFSTSSFSQNKSFLESILTTISMVIGYALY